VAPRTEAAFINGATGRRLTYKRLNPMNEKKTPDKLDAIADVILAYSPKPKSKPAKKRKRRAAKLVKLTKQNVELR
jgi:hypothetical protein